MKTFILILSLLVLAQTSQLSVTDLFNSQQASQLLGKVSSRFGHSVANAGDVNKDGYDDILVGARQQDSSKGAVYVIYGKPNLDLTNFDLSLVSLDPATTGFSIKGTATSAGLGTSVNSAGDINKDGYADIIIGSPGASSGKGEAYVIFGGPTGTRQDIDLATMSLQSLGLGFKITGSASSSLGTSVNSAGDVDKDGYDDIIILSTGSGSLIKGVVYVIYGGLSSALTDIDLSITTLSTASKGWSVTAFGDGDYVAGSVSAGDFNKDGFDDVIVGAPNRDSGKGAVYVIYGNVKSSLSDISLVSTSLSAVSKGFTITGTGTGGHLGKAVSSAGDVDGDGFDDIIIGSPDAGTGAATVIYGKSSLSDILLSNTIDTATTGWMIEGEAPNEYFGATVGGGGDANNDGYADIIIGAYNKGFSAGSVYVIYGKPRASLSNMVLSPTALDPATSGFSVLGRNFGNLFGNSVSISGDFNGDKRSDALVGAYSDTSKGATYVIFFSKMCAKNCDTCTKPLTCDVCSTGYQLITPVDGAYCCPPGCSSCTANPDICQTCAQRYYESSGSCLSCPAKCLQCSDGSSCSACESGYYWDGGACQSCVTGCSVCTDGSSCTTCSPKTYKSGSSCQNCLEGCATCSDGSTCDTCESGFVKDGSLCVECLEGTYESSGSCQSCLEGCATCSDSSTCDTCKPEYNQVGSQCTTGGGGGGDACSKGKYPSGGSCLNCPEGCSECTSASTCQACSDGYFLSRALHICLYDGDSREKAIQDVADGTSIFVSAISSGSSLPVYFGIMARIVRNTKYMKVQVSPELQRAFFSWKPSLSSLAPKSWAKESESKPLPWVFERYNLEPVYLINYWVPFLMIIIGFVLYAVFKVAEKTVNKQDTKTVKSSIFRFLHVAASNFALTQLYITIDEVIFYLLLDLRSSEFDGAFRVVSCVLAFVIFLVGIMVLGVHGYLLKKYQNLKQQKTIKTSSSSATPLQSFKYKCENVNLIFKDLKDTTLLTQSFLLIHLLRALLSSLIFVVLFDSPLAQVSLLLVFNLGAAIFLLVKKPFADLFNFFSQIFCEIIVLIALICMLIMAKYDESGSHSLDTMERLGKCMIVLNLTILIGSAVFMLIGALRGFYKLYQERKASKVLPNTAMNHESEQSPVDILPNRRLKGSQNSIAQGRSFARSSDFNSTTFIGQSDEINATQRNLLLDNSPVKIDMNTKRRKPTIEENMIRNQNEYRSRDLNHNQSQPSFPDLNLTGSPQLSSKQSPQLNFQKMELNHDESSPGDRTRARARSRIERLRKLSLLNK